MHDNAEGSPRWREAERRVQWLCSTVRAQSVLTVGCSDGLVAILLGRQGQVVTGIDSDANAIHRAQQQLAAEPTVVRERVRFIEADLSSHDFGNVQFDCVFLAEALAQLLQPERCIARAAQLLEPTGRLIVTVPFGPEVAGGRKQAHAARSAFRLLDEHFKCEEVWIFGKALGLVGVRATAGPGSSPGTQPTELHGMAETLQLIQLELTDETPSFELARLQERLTNVERVTLRDPKPHGPEQTSDFDATRLQQEVLSLNEKLRLAETSRLTLEIERRTSSDEASRLLRRLAEAQALLEAEALEAATVPELRARLARQDLNVEEQRTKLGEMQAALHALRAEGALQAAHAEQVRLAQIADREADRTEKERGHAALRQAEQRTEQMARLLQTARHTEQQSAARLERELRQRVAAEQSADRTRSTLSFQLGYALIQSFKSRAKLFSLPRKLWQLRAEAASRRSRKQLKPRA